MYNIEIIKKLLLWLGIVIFSLITMLYNERLQTIELAQNAARTHFNQDFSFRMWATSHGGIYVPVNEKTQPNPYLRHIKERDITTPSGKQLTLMNPAWMLKQLMRDYSGFRGTKGHITSSKLLNPENVADEWELNALKKFDDGQKEVFEFTQYNSTESLRLMKPLVTKDGCLKCHLHQGYKVGDIRGGISVTVPMKEYYLLENEKWTFLLIAHFIVFIIGLSFIIDQKKHLLW